MNCVRSMRGLRMKPVSVFVAGLLLAGLAANAQEKLSITVDDAVKMGLENSKAVHASLMRREYADAKSGEADAGRLPSVRFLGSYTKLSDVPPSEFQNPVAGIVPGAPSTITLSPTYTNNYNLRFLVTQPLFTGFRLSASSSAAENAMQAASEDLNGARAEQVYAVKNAYWSLYKAQEFKRVIDENVEQIKAHVNDVQQLMDQGMATTNDVLKVQVQLSDAQLRQIDAGNTVRIAMLGLNNALGVSLGTTIELTSTIHQSEKKYPGIQELVSEARDNRPDLRAMRFRVKSAEDGVTASRSAWFPQVYLTGNYYYQRPNQRIFPSRDIFKDTWDVSLNVSLDIWNWGTTVHQSDEAQAQLAETKDGLAQLQDGVTLEITQTYLNMQQARERIGVAQKGREQAEENYRVTKRRFNEGLTLNSDMLDAEVALLQARTNYTQALVDYELAAARLDKAIGR